MGSEDQSHFARVFVKGSEDRDTEGPGFSGAGLRGPQDVFSFQGGGNRSLLNGSRTGETHFLQGTTHGFGNG